MSAERAKIFRLKQHYSEESARLLITAYFTQFPQAHTRPSTIVAWALRNGWQFAQRDDVIRRMRQMAVDDELTRDDQGLYRMVPPTT